MVAAVLLAAALVASPAEDAARAVQGVDRAFSRASGSRDIRPSPRCVERRNADGKWLRVIEAVTVGPAPKL